MLQSLYRYFESLFHPYPTLEYPPQSPPKTLFAFCRFYLRGFMWPIIAIVLISGTIAVLEVYLFDFMGELVNWLTDSTPETFWDKHGTSLLWMGFILVIALPALTFLFQLIDRQSFMGNFPMSVRWRAHNQMLLQSMQFYQDEFAGRVATKVMQTALSIRQLVLTLGDVMVYAATYLLTAIFVAYQADPLLMIPILAWFLGYMLTLSVMLPKLQKIATEQADARSTMTGRIVDSYTNIHTVKLFSSTDQERQYTRSAMRGFLGTVYRQMRYVSTLDMIISTMGYLLVFAMAAMSIWLWSKEAVTIGAISAGIALTLRLNAMSHWIMWEIGQLFESIGMVADGMKMLSKPLAILDKPNAKVLEVEAGKIKFDDVEFHYGKENGIISALNLEIKPGEKVGLVGRSGAGKSTILNLLLRLYETEGGKITIDGQSVSEVTQESLRAAIGMVTQDTALLHRTVRENIIYGNPDATDEQVERALEMSEATQFIDDLVDPKGNRGLDAMVGERGIKLSGGQRQRIAIARVLLKNAPILLLDEATSALDSEVEAAIQSSLYKLMEGKTVIAIAHRLSTIAAMDRLIVLDKGKIIQQGTHDELVNADGLYAELWRHQTGGYLPE